MTCTQAGISDFEVTRSAGQAFWVKKEEGVVIHTQSLCSAAQVPGSISEVYDWLSPKYKLIDALEFADHSLGAILHLGTDLEGQQKHCLLHYEMATSHISVYPYWMVDGVMVDFQSASNVYKVPLFEARDEKFEEALRWANAQYFDAHIQYRMYTKFESHWERYSRIAMRCLGMTRLQFEEHKADESQHTAAVHTAYRIAARAEGKTLMDLGVEIDRWHNEQARAKSHASLPLEKTLQFFRQSHRLKVDTWDCLYRNALKG